MSKLNQITSNSAPRPGAQCNFIPNTAFRTLTSPRKRVSTVNTDPSLTKQNHKAECDINDYQESMNIVAKAQSMFNQLPSQIRNEFDNDPSLFLDFVQDPQNEDQLVEMGLANPREKIEPAAPITAPKAGSNEDGAKAPSDKPQGASGTVTT